MPVIPMTFNGNSDVIRFRCDGSHNEHVPMTHTLGGLPFGWSMNDAELCFCPVCTEAARQ